MYVLTLETVATPPKLDKAPAAVLEPVPPDVTGNGVPIVSVPRDKLPDVLLAVPLPRANWPAPSRVIPTSGVPVTLAVDDQLSPPAAIKVAMPVFASMR